MCVRLTQGRRDDAKIYNVDPIGVASGFAGDGAEMLHVVDLDGALSDPNSRNREVLREIIKAVNVPVQFGGGLRSLEDVARVLDLECPEW